MFRKMPIILLAAIPSHLVYRPVYTNIPQTIHLLFELICKVSDYFYVTHIDFHAALQNYFPAIKDCYKDDLLHSYSSMLFKLFINNN